jgi:hypothetical protein
VVGESFVGLIPQSIDILQVIAEIDWNYAVGIVIISVPIDTQRMGWKEPRMSCFAETPSKNERQYRKDRGHFILEQGQIGKCSRAIFKILFKTKDCLVGKPRQFPFRNISCFHAIARSRKCVALAQGRQSSTHSVDGFKPWENVCLVGFDGQDGFPDFMYSLEEFFFGCSKTCNTLHGNGYSKVQKSVL